MNIFQDKVVEAMASMFFLRGITSPSLMLKHLASREASLKEFLLHHESRSAKTFIGQTSMSIVSCVRTVHKAFVMQQVSLTSHAVRLSVEKVLKIVNILCHQNSNSLRKSFKVGRIVIFIGVLSLKTG